jgi:DnaB-like helicase C terminal domain
MRCGLNASRLKHATLTDEEMTKIKKGFRLLKHVSPFIISADISATTTVSGLSGKIDQHKPDILFVDGVYLMDNEVGAEPFSTQAYTSVSRGLKRLAQRTKIPVVGTVQALTGKMGKDGAVTMHSLGWTSAWAQDADIILGVERGEANNVRLRVVAGRDVTTCDLQMVCNWDETHFEEVGDNDDEGE